jgi:Rab GDP dissociation inhibitor
MVMITSIKNLTLVPCSIDAGLLVKILIKTDVHKYLEFKSIDGSYVVKDKKPHKVPAGKKEALASSLLGVMEKGRFQKFLEFVNDYEPENPSTHKGTYASSTHHHYSPLTA